MLREKQANTWNPEVGSAEDRIAERLVKRGWLVVDPLGGYQIRRDTGISIPGVNVPPPAIGSDARELLLEASRDRQGAVMSVQNQWQRLR
jgi:hypothetical protein